MPSAYIVYYNLRSSYLSFIILVLIVSSLPGVYHLLLSSAADVDSIAYLLAIDVTFLVDINSSTIKIACDRYNGE